MVKGGDAARKKAADCMTLAAEASSHERRDMLRAMAELGDARKSNGPI